MAANMEFASPNHIPPLQGGVTCALSYLLYVRASLANLRLREPLNHCLIVP